MFIRPRILSILTTRRCTAACDHCCVGSSPTATSSITPDRILRLIDEAVRIGTIERVVFTGGEAFLLGRSLDSCIARANAAGFETRIVTNGYWAVGERAADERLRALRDAGLDELMISSGRFHQQFVPVARVVAAACAAARLRIRVRIALEDCDQSTFDETSLRDGLRAEIASGAVSIAYDPWIADAGGRGRATLTHDARRRRGGGDVAGGCASILTTIAVTPDMMLTACCGFPLEELPGLRIGSVADAALDDVLRAAPDDLLKVFLHVLGPQGIAEFVARHRPGYVLPGNPISICAACIALQRDADAMATAARHAGEIAESVISSFVQGQTMTVPAR